MIMLKQKKKKKKKQQLLAPMTEQNMHFYI